VEAKVYATFQVFWPSPTQAANVVVQETTNYRISTTELLKMLQWIPREREKRVKALHFANQTCDKAYCTVVT